MVIPGWLWRVYEALLALFDAGGIPFVAAQAAAWGIIIGVAIGIAATLAAKEK